MEPFKLASEDQLELACYAWTSGNQPKAVVQLVHGMAEHVSRYDQLATALVGEGYAVYGHDHRGHGGSIPPGDEPGHFADEDGWNLAVRDVHRVNRELAGRHPGLPIVIIAHSMGSFMLQQLLSESPDIMVAAALSGTNGKPPPLIHAGRLLTRVERRRLGPRGKSALIHKMSFEDFNKPFEPSRTDVDWLSRDTVEVDKYVSDPLCGFKCTVQVWFDMLEALGKLTSPENVSRIPKDMPIFAFCGSDDPVGGERGVKNLVDTYRAAWMTDVQLKIYPGGRHEMLHEVNRDEVVQDLLHWVNRVIEKRPAQAASQR